MPRPSRDLTGQKYHELTVLGPSTRKSFWRVRCSCGNEKELLGQSLVSGNTKSCGHLRASLAGKRIRLANLATRMYPTVLEADILKHEELVKAITVLRHFLAEQGLIVKKGQVISDAFAHDPLIIKNSHVRALGYALLHGVAQTHQQLGRAIQMRQTQAYKTMTTVAEALKHDPGVSTARVAIDRSDDIEYKQASIKALQDALKTGKPFVNPNVASEKSGWDKLKGE